MKLNLIAARSENGVIGDGPTIPWQAKGEQLLFKAHSYNQWLIVGRKTFESMGVLSNRKYAVISKTLTSTEKEVLCFSSIESCLDQLARHTSTAFVAGGGEIYSALIGQCESLHLSTVHITVEGDVRFPEIPDNFELAYRQRYHSNIDYTYELWTSRSD